MAVATADTCLACGFETAKIMVSCPECGGTAWVKATDAIRIERPRASAIQDAPLPGPWSVAGRIPAGSLVSLSGQPGAGKSSLAAALAASRAPAAWLTAEQTTAAAARFLARFAEAEAIPTIYPAHDRGAVDRFVRDLPRFRLGVVDSLTQLGGWDEQARILDAIRLACKAHAVTAVLIQQVNARGAGAGLTEIRHMVDQIAYCESAEGGLRRLGIEKNREGPVGSRYYSLDAALTVPTFPAAYSVEGDPGSYGLHPFPLPGARWAGILAACKPGILLDGIASAGIMAPCYRNGILYPADVLARQAFAEAHGLRWIDSPKTSNEEES